MKKYIILLLLISSTAFGAVKDDFPCTGLTGGTVGALDYYGVASLSEGDETHCMVSGEVIHFRFDYDGTGAENTTTHPYTVRPDDYSTQGTWVEFEPPGGLEADSVNDTHIDWGTGANQVSITDVPANNWKAFYSNGSGVITELALGASDKFLMSNGAAAAPTFETPSYTTANVFNVADYDVGDDDADIQAAIDAAEAVKGRVYIPPGTYTLDASLTVTEPIEIFGAGMDSTILQVASNTLDVFSVTASTNESISIHDMRIQNNNTTPTDGAGILVNPASGQNNYSRFYNLFINGMYRGIEFQKAALWVVRDSFIQVSEDSDIYVANTNVPDSGDSYITGCVFSGDSGSNYGVQAVSSGGLKIMGNKFLGHDTAIYVNIASNAPAGSVTSIFLIEGNSIENFRDHGVNMSNNDADPMYFFIINGNQFASTSGDGSTNGIVVGGDWKYFVISSNVMVVVPSNYVIVLNDGDYFTITGNVLYGDGTDIGIGINSVCTNGFISLNRVENFATRISNGSSTTTVLDTRTNVLALNEDPQTQTKFYSYTNGSTVYRAIRGHTESTSVADTNDGVYGSSLGAGSGTNVGVRGNASGSSGNNYHFYSNDGDNCSGGAWNDSSSPDRKRLIREMSDNERDNFYDILDQIDIKGFRHTAEMEIIGYNRPEDEIKSEILRDNTIEDGKKYDAIRTRLLNNTIYGDPKNAPQRFGPMANELPDFLSTKDKKGYSPGRMASFLVVIVQHQKELINDLMKRIEALEVQ